MSHFIKMSHSIKTYHFIVNPVSKSGRGLKIWLEVEPYLKKEAISYKAYFSKAPGHITTIVNELTSEYEGDYVNIVILGGDGTMNEALQGIADFAHTRLAYLPTGSSNDLARDLGISGKPLDILEEILSADTVTPMDMGVLTYNSMTKDRSRLHNKSIRDTRYFSVSCGIGFDAAICEEALASKLKNLFNKMGLGKLTYGGIAVKQLFTTPKASCDLYLDDKPPIHIKRLWLMAVMNHQYEGGGMKFCPGADYHDGLLSICAAGNMSAAKVFIMLPSVFSGSHVKKKGVHIYQAKQVRIKTEFPLWVHTDGEVSVQSDDITVTCRQETILMLNGH